ncbi:MAG: hypothetical protein RIT81_38490 [Deltaproteobacteria bacterium]
MASEKIGRAKSGKGNSYEVFWDPSSRDVYVGYAGKTHIGRATSAAQAQRMAEAWLAGK